MTLNVTGRQMELSPAARRRDAGVNGTRQASPAPLEPRPQDGPPQVIRWRRSNVKPMSVDDAVLEFAAGDRSVLVFREAISDAVAVLCRRPDGNFWLIEPDA